MSVYNFLNVHNLCDDVDLLEYLSLTTGEGECGVILCKNAECVFLWAKHINLERFRARVILPSPFDDCCRNNDNNNNIIITTIDIFCRSSFSVKFVVAYFCDCQTSLAAEAKWFLVNDCFDANVFDVKRAIRELHTLDNDTRDFLACNGYAFDVYENSLASNMLVMQFAIGYHSSANKYWSCNDLERDFPRALKVWPDNFALVKNKPSVLLDSDTIVFCVYGHDEMSEQEVYEFSKNILVWPSINTKSCSSSSSWSNNDTHLDALRTITEHYGKFSLNNRLINMSPTRVKKIWMCIFV